MNKLKDCQAHGKIIGTPISEVSGGQCALDSNASMEQKYHHVTKYVYRKLIAITITLDGNKCSLYKHFKEVVPSNSSRSFKSLKGCNKDNWTVKTLVNS